MKLVRSTDSQRRAVSAEMPPSAARAAGQGLGHLVHEQKVLGAGQHEPAGGWVFVHRCLDVGQKIGDMLDFIEDKVTLEQSAG